MRPSHSVPRPLPRPDSGFALGLVVLLLFAIGVAGATGYQAVRTDFDMSLGEQDSRQALNLARAGLRRFVGGWVGNFPDTVIRTTYDFTAGTAVVTARPLVVDGDDEILLVSSEGRFTDPRWADRPAVRTVHQHVRYRTLPLLPLGAFMTPANQVSIGNRAEVDGEDLGTCRGDVAGVVSRDANVQVQGDLGGSPPETRIPGNEQNFLDSLGVAWDILTDPTFPFEHDGISRFPDHRSYPADSFPAIRIQGDFSPDRDQRGQGFLLVTGQFDPQRNFQWEGIILAGSTPQSLSERNVDIEGMLVVGLDGGQSRVDLTGQNFRVRWDSCDAADAGRAIGHLEPVGNTWWEGD